MGINVVDPGLYLDEHILLRTQDIFINAIPFEGILTNKRIILTGKTSILLPRIEIPLNILRNIEAADDAIDNQIIKLTLRRRQRDPGDDSYLLVSDSRDPD